MQTRIRTLVVDDHQVVVEGLCRLLDSEPDIEVVGTTGRGAEAVALCETHRPHVVLLDYSLPDLDGIEVARQILAQNDGPFVLVLTMHANEEYATRLIQIGASGYVLKAASSDELLTAIRRAANDEIYVSPEIQERILKRLWKPAEEAPETALTNRELQVLLRLARGATSREVASELSIALSTAETHRSRVLSKLDLRNNSDLTRFALRRGLIALE